MQCVWVQAVLQVACKKAAGLQLRIQTIVLQKHVAGGRHGNGASERQTPAVVAMKVYANTVPEAARYGRRLVERRETSYRPHVR